MYRLGAMLSSGVSGSDAIMGSLTDGFTSAGTQILAILGAAIVAGIGIYGAKIAVTTGLSFFQKISHKG